MFYGHIIGYYCWDKLYNMNFIRKNKLYFDVHYKIGEDAEFVNKYIRKCNRLILMDNRSYVHVVNSNSVMQNLFNVDACYSLYSAIELSGIFENTTDSKKVKRAINVSVVLGQEHLLRIMCACGIYNDIYKKELSCFKRHFIEAIFNSKVNVKQKMKIMMMGFIPFRRQLYYLIYKLKK